MFAPLRVPCPMDNETEFLLVAHVSIEGVFKPRGRNMKSNDLFSENSNIEDRPWKHFTR